jgi:hypothetical protein
MTTKIGQVKQTLADILKPYGSSVRLMEIGLVGERIPLSPPVLLSHGDRLLLTVVSADGEVTSRADLTQSEVFTLSDQHFSESK